MICVHPFKAGGLKLKVTSGPHETKIKVSRATLKKMKNKIEPKIHICEKTGQMA